jgi:peptidoglycan/xylan/chitin deacetylase (PgdA/CDA1 family)
MSFYKSFARDLLGLLGSSTPLMEQMKRLFLNHTPIVLYHSVGGNAQNNGSLAGPTLNRFKDDLGFLENYFEFVSLPEILAYNAGWRTCAAPPLAITFDDGFDIIRSGAIEVLRAHRIKATFFVTTSCLDNKSLMWRNKLQAVLATKNESTCMRNYNELMRKSMLPQISSSSELLSASKRWPYLLKEVLADELWNLCDMPPVEEYLDENRPYFSERDLDSLLLEGHQVGLHTHTHPFCSQLNAEAVNFEVTAPALYLRKRFNLQTVPFAYPFGDRLDSETEKSLCDAGTISCALGNKGFQRRGCKAYSLERSGCDNGVSFPVFGKSLARMVISIPDYQQRVTAGVYG